MTCFNFSETTFTKLMFFVYNNNNSFISDLEMLVLLFICLRICTDTFINNNLTSSDTNLNPGGIFSNFKVPPQDGGNRQANYPLVGMNSNLVGVSCPYPPNLVGRHIFLSFVFLHV